jgi:DNA topoisomerase-3
MNRGDSNQSNRRPMETNHPRRPIEPIPTNQSFNSQSTSLADTPHCRCSLPSVLRTVKKEGPNCGKAFYGCSKGMSGGCDFFQV